MVKKGGEEVKPKAENLSEGVVYCTGISDCSEIVGEDEKHGTICNRICFIQITRQDR